VRVAVLMGGRSAEREVSLDSGVQVSRALRRAGHEVVAFDTVAGPLSGDEEARLLERGVGAEPPPPPEGGASGERELLAALDRSEVREADVVFPTLHGGAGEDGRLQGALELAGLRYAGSGPLGCALAMDKEISKRLFRDAGVPTADWRTARGAEEGPDGLGLPLIVKPVSGGSTVGLSLVREEGALPPAIELAREFDERVMLEAYVPGREITVGVLDGEALPVGEIVPEHELFDYECKYQPGLAEEIFPADLPPPVAERARGLALRVHEVLRLRGFSRVDFILDGDDEPLCLEANALPGMTSNSLVPKAAAAAGIGFPELCDRIVRAAAGSG